MARVLASLTLLFWVFGRIVPTGHQGTSYCIVQERLTFLEAYAVCTQWGGHLVQAHQVATRDALQKQLRGTQSWWVVWPPTAGMLPSLQQPQQPPAACTWLSSPQGLLQYATGAACYGRRPTLCMLGPVMGGGCPSWKARSTGPRAEWKQEATLVGSFPGPSPQELMPQRLIWRHKQPLPDATEIWEALQSIAPGRWRQELVHQLLEPMQEDGNWSTLKLTDEVGLFQAVSEHLLQEGARPAPYRHLLGILAAHGMNRLLQVALGPCLPRTAAGNTQRREALVAALMQIIHNLAQALQEQETSHPLAMETPLISIYVCRVNSSTMGKMRLSFPSNPPAAASVILPEQSALGGLVPPGTHLHVQMVSFLGSPFFTGMAQTVTGTVAELNLLSGGAEIGISNLSAPVQIFLPQTMAAVFAPAIRISSGEALLLRVNMTQTEASLLIHAVLDPKGPLKLFLQSPPQPDTIEPHAEQGGFTWLMGPEGLSTLDGQPCYFLIVPSSPSALMPVTLHISTYGVQCFSWHPPSAQWRDEGCRVGRQSSLAQGHCLCSHLSFFGSSFWVVPVQLDVVRTAEYFGRVTKNPVLALLLGVLYALYLPGVAWARWMDLHDQPRVRPTVLASDDPCAQYCYLLCIGLPGPQGPGVICIQLKGSGGDSQAHRLPPGASVFLLHEPWPLGELQSIWLWQESSGEKEQPSQYVTQATVLDLQQGARAHFPCHTLLAPAKDGPSMPQGFSVAPQQQLRMISWALFWRRTLRGLQEEHTLLVVLSPPTHTQFTRVQRLSCGLCLLLCSALISLMFWEVPTEDSPQLLHLGSFSLSWKDIMVGVESALMTFPINLLVVFIFRHTKPRRSSESSQAAVRPNASTSPSRLDNVLQSLRTAVQALGTAQKLPGLAVLQQSWRPKVDLDRLLQLLAHFVHLENEAKEASTEAEPRILTTGSNSPDSLHQAYCARYLVLKLAHVTRLLEELGSGAEALKQQVHEVAEMLAQSIPADLLSPRPRWGLPWWALLVGWALLVSLSATSTFFILLYGFQYGKESSIRWLLSTAFSLGQSILVLQPLKVMACAIFFTLILKRADSDDEMGFDLEG